QSTTEATKPAESDPTHTVSATSGNEAGEGTTPLTAQANESITKLALDPITSPTDRNDASKTVPSSGKPAVTVGVDKQRVSQNGSPINDPIKHAWPVARKAEAKKKLIDF
ncbi:MAG: hypothetical protein Q9184_006570, partial [Pyrenodesmia sp. 2 TL-2023]